MPQDKIEKLKDFLKVFNEGLTKSDFTNAFKQVLVIIQQIKSRTEQAIDKMERTYSTFGSLKTKLDSDTSATITKAERTIAAELESLLRRFSTEQKKIDDKLSMIENGKDADEEKMMKEMMAQLPKLQEIVNETIKQIPQQEEKVFGIDDIEGLKKAMEELETKILSNRRLGGGGFSALALNGHILDPYVPAGTVNGSNKDFTLKKAANPATSLKVYRGGQKQQLTTDYTVSGITVSFLVAPVVGEIIEVEHRI